MSIDLIISFVIAFLCIFITLVVARRRASNKSYQKKLEEKLQLLIKQQEELLESTSDRASSFMRENEGWDTSAENSSDTIVDKIKKIMKKAGIIDMSMNMFVFICAAGGAVLTSVLIYFSFADAYICVATGLPVGAYLAYNVLAAKAAKRKELFIQQFPDAIDMMIRGVKAGLNISRVVKLARYIPLEPPTASIN
ncbi:hypothetical protein FACS1894122_15640 [Alphaproteobacteria bacterium]|nr:hypothetical protein FACS1894122_15640 [Alphaproteobacteria bacterium]